MTDDQCPCCTSGDGYPTEQHPLASLCADCQRLDTRDPISDGLRLADAERITIQELTPETLRADLERTFGLAPGSTIRRVNPCVAEDNAEGLWGCKCPECLKLQRDCP